MQMINSACLSVLLLLLCFNFTALPVHAMVNVSTLVYPTASTTGWAVDASASYFVYVDGPNPVSGVMAHKPSGFGEQFQPTGYGKNGVAFFSAEIVLPNLNDDIYGCDPPVFQKRTELNETFTNKIIMVRRGFCAFGVKASRAAATGAAAVVVAGCDTAAPLSCDGTLSSMVGSQPVGVPATYIQSDDGFKIYNYLLARQQAKVAGGTVPAPIYLHFVATGPLNTTERAALSSLASLTTMSQDVSGAEFGNLRPFNPTTVNDPTIDPCQKRIAGLWCENGRIVEWSVDDLEWSSNLPDGSIPPIFGTFTKLRRFAFINGRIAGQFPSTFCSLTNLEYIMTDGQTGAFPFTGFPSCMGALTKLKVLSFANNQVRTLPDLSRCTLLNFIDATNNHLIALPTTFPNWVGLVSVTFDFNLLTALPPHINSLVNLAKFSAKNNQILFTLTDVQFDNMTNLVELDLSFNQLTGILPNFQNCVNLGVVNFNNNQINGSIPRIWRYNIPNVNSLQLSHNNLTSPCNVLSTLSYLQVLDLSYNLLTATSDEPTLDNNIGAFLSGVAGPSLAKMYLNNNLLAGTWDNGWLGMAGSIVEIILDDNQIQSLPSTVFDVPFSVLSVANNNLTTWLAADIPPITVIYFNLVGNPLLRAPSGELPVWIVQNDAQLISNPQLDYLCPTLSSTTSRTFQLYLDASFTDYNGCICAKGSFGIAPICDSLPQVATLTTSGNPRSSNEVGDDFLTFISASIESFAMNSVNTTIDEDAEVAFQPNAFTDSWYGDARLTQGMTTSFFIDLSNGTTEASSNNNNNETGTNSEVLYITIRFLLSAEMFSYETDVLQIHMGDPSLNGTRVAMLRGTETSKLSPYGFTSMDNGTVSTVDDSGLWWGNFSDSGITSHLIAPEDTLYWEVRVLGSQATISFSSRDESGTHFVAYYASSNTCPTNFFLDANLGGCRPNLIPFQTSSSLRLTVLLTGFIALLWVLFITVGVLVFWNSSVIRASSRRFLLLMLFFLALMSVGSMLYGQVPTLSSSGKFICQARAWLAAWPLTGILAVLLAKSNRLDQIFGSVQLNVKVVTDGQLLATVSVMLAIVSIFLGVYSGAPLTAPDVSEGTGELAGQLVSSCHNRSGFTVWVSILLVYIFILMVVAAGLGWRCRDLPSRFNESSHILNALVVLILYGVLIVPIVWYVQDQPNAAILIQGIGQSLLCVLLTTILFAPKLYTAFAQRNLNASSNQLTPNTMNSHGTNTNNNTNPSTSELTVNPVAGAYTPVKHQNSTLGREPPKPAPAATVAAATSPKNNKQTGRQGTAPLPVAVNPNAKKHAAAVGANAAAAVAPIMTQDASPPNVENSIELSPVISPQPAPPAFPSHVSAGAVDAADVEIDDVVPDLPLVVPPPPPPPPADGEYDYHSSSLLPQGRNRVDSEME